MSLRFALRVFVAAFLVCGPVVARAEAGTLRVGIHEKPPYAMRVPGGHWEGLSVDLWEQIALATGWTYNYVEMPLIPNLR